MMIFSHNIFKKVRQKILVFFLLISKTPPRTWTIHSLFLLDRKTKSLTGVLELSKKKSQLFCRTFYENLLLNMY